MNMPNLASCHQAMRWARVAASGDAAGWVAWRPGGAMASAFAAVSARADAALICFRKDRLELSLHCMDGFPLVSDSRSGMIPRCPKARHLGHPESSLRV